MMRSQEVIDAEVKALKELLPKVRPFDAFGGDNKAKMQAEIDILEGTIDEGDINRMFDDGEDDEASSAQSALDWLEGNDSDGSPSEDWKSLCK